MLVGDTVRTTAQLAEFVELLFTPSCAAMGRAMQVDVLNDEIVDAVLQHFA